MSRRLDGLEDVVITGTDMRLALIVCGEGVGRSGWFWFGAAGTSCAMSAEEGRPSSISSCSFSIVSILFRPMDNEAEVLVRRFVGRLLASAFIDFSSADVASRFEQSEPAVPVLLLRSPANRRHHLILPSEGEKQSNGYRFLQKEALRRAN
jgi:hypothetical protein